MGDSIKKTKLGSNQIRFLKKRVEDYENNPNSGDNGLETHIYNFAKQALKEAGEIEEEESEYPGNPFACRCCGKISEDDDFCSPDCLEKFLKKHLKKPKKK